MKKITFEELPSVIADMAQRLQRIEEFLTLNTKPAEDANDYINAKMASRLLNLSVPTIYAKVCRKELPVYKQGNRLYFSRTELLSYIEDGKKKTHEDYAGAANKLLRNHKFQ